MSRIKWMLPAGLVVAFATVMLGTSMCGSYDERQVAGATMIAASTTVRFEKPFEPSHRTFEVCLRLAAHYGYAPPRMEIMNPDGTFTHVRAIVEANGAAVPLEERSFRNREGQKFACFYEGGYDVPRRRYLSATFESDKPLPVDGVVLADYDPK